MTAPTSAQMRAHEKRVAGMYRDPECVGELLLVGIAMARSIDLGDPGWGADGSMPTRVISERVYGNRRLPTQMLGVGQPHTSADSNPYHRLRNLFRADRRRYDPDYDMGARPWGMVTCGRPMVRRDGLCQRDATTTRRVTDPATGLRSWVGACGQKPCRAWLAGLLERNRAEVVANPPPAPAANTGGVLERHLPEIDWWKVWRHVDKDWTPPPEGRPFTKPRLTLLVGDDDPDAPTVTARPTLQVLDGGWR